LCMRQITTLYQDNQIITDRRTVQTDPNETNREKELVNLYPQVTYQTITGFGGAFTDAAGYVFSQMPQNLQAQLLNDYFAQDGLRYTLGRTSIDSCDFSLEGYAAADMPGDTALEFFDAGRAKRYVLPMILRAGQVAGQPIQMMLTPWSPPAWMKTNHAREYGGYLKEEYYDVWAEYICRFIRQYQADGVHVCMLSAQNEPNAAQTWDSCLFSGGQEQVFIQRHLYPALCRNGLDGLLLLIWDHNKERAFDRACETICNDAMEKMVGGVALHWYSGDHFEALQMITERFPGKQIIFSEACVEYHLYPEQNQLRNAQMYAHDIIGNLNAGMNAFIDWNLLLDEHGGPNHSGNFCDAPMMYNRQTEVLQKNLSYEYIGHFSRYIQPGAVRIGLSRFDPRLEATAFKNPDGSLCAIVLNQSQTVIPFFFRMGDQVWPVRQQAESISTYVFDAD